MKNQKNNIYEAAKKAVDLFEEGFITFFELSQVLTNLHEKELDTIKKSNGKQID